MAARRPGLVAKKISVQGRGGKRHQRTYWVKPNIAQVVRLRRAKAAGEMAWGRSSAAGSGAGTQVEPFTIPAHDVSSTAVRERVARGEPIDGLVPPDVATYIAEHGLYRRD